MKKYIEIQEQKIQNLKIAKAMIQEGIEISSITQVNEFNQQNDLFKINLEINESNGTFGLISIDFLDLVFFISERTISKDGTFEELDFSNALSQIEYTIVYLEKNLQELHISEPEILEMIELKRKMYEIEERYKVLSLKASSAATLANSISNFDDELVLVDKPRSFLLRST